MTELIPLISEKQIQDQIKKTAKQIDADYSGKDLILLGILKGSFIFLSDLSRKISIPHEIDLIGVSSYAGTSSTGKIQFTKAPDLSFENKDILIVEDIVDTGKTLVSIIENIRKKAPHSVKICALIDKHERRELNIIVNYSCFTLEKGFIVGYGLDYNEKYRHLPAIYDLKL